jgi:hypothetical protein
MKKFLRFFIDDFRNADNICAKKYVEKKYYVFGFDSDVSSLRYAQLLNTLSSTRKLTFGQKCIFSTNTIYDDVSHKLYLSLNISEKNLHNVGHR